MTQHTTLHEQLLSLGLRYIAAELDDIIAHATKKRMGAVEILEHVAELEARQRGHKSMERRMGRAKLGRFKPMPDFDWAWPTRIDRDVVESIVNLDFLHDGRNVILVAPHGLGKTMIAKNAVHQAVLTGHSSIFITAAKLLLDLGAQESARGLERRLRHYGRPAVLAIDELGYLSYDNRNADLLFQVISRRYEAGKSLILTTNLAFSDWPTVFPNATSTTALIDRAVHHADIVSIEGESYRRREAEATKKTRAARRKTKASAPEPRA